MKKGVFSLALLLLFAGAMFGQRITIDLPSVARIIGIQTTGSVSITNGTPFYAEITTQQDNVTVPPDGLVEGKVKIPLDFTTLEVPAMVTFFRDSEKKNVVAFAARMLYATVGNNDHWTITPWELIYPDGRPSGTVTPYASAYPANEYRRATRQTFEINLPIVISSKTWLQCVNATNFGMAMRIQGYEKVLLGPGDLCRGSWGTVSDFPTVLHIEGEILDRGLIVGTWERDIYVSQGTIQNYQFIVDPSQINWR